MTMPKLWTGIGTVAWDVSSYIHPIIAIIDKYMNLPKGCKLEDFILVGEGNRRFWRGGGLATPVYSFFRDDFSDAGFFFAQFYVHVM